MWSCLLVADSVTIANPGTFIVTLYYRATYVYGIGKG